MFVVALAARLDAREYTQLTVIPNGGGTVEAEGGIDCDDSCMALYRGNIGEVTLFASPNPGYVFDGWTGACAFAGANPECTINVWSPANPRVGTRFTGAPPPPPPTVRNISTLTINMHLAGNYKYTQLAVLLLERAAQGGGQPLPDVIFIQEAFYNEGTLAHPYPVFRQLLGQLYPYQAHGPFGEGLHWFGSGLLILSRLPFVNTGDMAYDACANGTWRFPGDPPWDCFSRKGVAAAIINFGPRCGNVAFFNTHTNSTYEPGERSTQLARFRQMTEYWHFVHVMTGWDDGAPVIAGGDFNLFEYEINVFDYLSYTLLTAGFPGSLNSLGFTESEPWCAAHPSQCVGFSPHHRWLPLSTTGYNGGLEKNFTRDNPGRGIRITPIQFLKYPPTSWGGISDHVVLESVYRLSCGE